MRHNRHSVFFLLFWSLFLVWPVQASVYYDFDIIAKTGTSAAGGILTSVGGGPSINDNGTVAFTGTVQSGASSFQGLFKGTGGGSAPQWISQGFTSSPSSLTFSSTIQLNNVDWIVSRESQSGSPPITRLRRWSSLGGNPGGFLIPASSSGSSPYGPIFSVPSMNNNGDIVFPAFPSSTYLSAGPNDIKLVYVNAAQILLPDFSFSTSSCSGYLTKIKEATIPPGSTVRPMLADNGRVVVRVVDEFGKPAIRLYNPSVTILKPEECSDGALPTKADFSGESSYDTIAASADDGFSSFGSSPGISDDGKIITFYGELTAPGAVALNTTPGPGIFASIDMGGARSIVRVAGSSSPELGYNALGEPLFLQTFDIDSRVAVTHLELGDAGLVEDSFVVSFIATPSAASRINPQTNKPFTFSANKGLWTVRVDVDRDLSDPSAPPRFHPTSPIPVVQVGDTVHPSSDNFTVSNFAVYDPLASAATDDTGAARTPQKGDHRITFWATDGTKSSVIRGTHLDSDQDGLLDHWETKGIDADQDGTPDLNLAAMGAGPNKRDLFLEIDWIEGVNDKFAPQPEAFKDLVAMFESHGITVHVDAGPEVEGRSINLEQGPFQGGGIIPYVNYVYFSIPANAQCRRPISGAPFPRVTFKLDDKGKFALGRSFDDIKKEFFGKADTDKGAREFAFHYVIFADLAETPECPVAGIAEEFWRPDVDSIPGNDLLISLSGEKSWYPLPTGFLQAQVLAHELGHNLGLRHGGVDFKTSFPPYFDDGYQEVYYKPSYLSLMNYAYTAGLVDYIASTTDTTLGAGHPYTFTGADGGIGGVAQLGNSTAEVAILDGRGAGQRRVITANTPDTLAISEPWTTIPPALEDVGGGKNSRFAVLFRDYSHDNSHFAHFRAHFSELP